MYQYYYLSLLRALNRCGDKCAIERGVGQRDSRQALRVDRFVCSQKLESDL